MPRVVITPRGFGLVSIASKVAPPPSPRPRITRSWISNTRGSLPGSRGTISNRASRETMRSITSGEDVAPAGGLDSRGDDPRSRVCVPDPRRPPGGMLISRRSSSTVVRRSGERTSPIRPALAEYRPDADQRRYISATVVPQGESFPDDLRARKDGDVQRGQVDLTLKSCIQRSDCVIPDIRRQSRRDREQNRADHQRERNEQGERSGAGHRANRSLAARSTSVSS